MPAAPQPEIDPQRKTCYNRNIHKSHVLESFTGGTAMKHLKKTLCLLLAAVMLLALGVPAMATGEVPVDAAHFPDQALRTYVTDYCDTNKDNKLSAAECEAVQCIDLFEMKITKVADMTGIEHFTNLHELIACNNQIATLDLSGMTKLEKLDVSGCGKLQSLKLAGCSALTQLDASSCALTVLDLTGCSALKTVACSYNALTALDVSAAEKLTTLECSANRLTVLDLSGHKALKVLTCSLNSLTKLDLTGCTALESLDCSDNALAALDLSGCTALNATAQGDGKAENPILSPQYLPEQTGAVTDGGKCTVYFDVIVGKDNLGSITRVPDANYDKQTGAAVYAKTPDYFAYSYDTGRKGLPAMTVYFEMQGLTSGVALDEKAFPDAAFRTLLAETVDGNGDSLLSTLETRRVSELNCSGLGIADLTGIEHFTQLVALNCENNELTALDVSSNKLLSEIYCGGNRLATLDLTGLPIKDAETDTGHMQKLTGSYTLSGTENGVGLFDLSQIVGKDNIGSITEVKGAAYDKKTGIARYSAAVETPSYTYSTGSSAVSLTVEFALDLSKLPKTPFEDVKAGAWYFDAVLEAFRDELMVGMSETEFSPGAPMTRAMLVAVLHRLAGSPSVSGKMPFTDVASGTWYHDAVLWASQNGIVAGMSETTFAPQENITREQIVAIFSRYTAKFSPDKTEAAAELTGFADSASVSDWALDDMKWAVAYKVINGSPSAGKLYLNPQGNATRAEVATILMQYRAL
jgi:Leucine-rich repeat (LRR) protein